MIIERMIEAGARAYKGKVSDVFIGMVEGELTPELAREVTPGLKKVIAATASAVFRAFIESKESVADVMRQGNEVFRFKYLSEKTFTTLWGQQAVPRQVCQIASDTRSFVPLDALWGMAGESMTMEAREAVAAACAHVTPQEKQALLGKCVLFHPHTTQMKKVANRLGSRLEAHEEEPDSHVRDEETLPEGVRVLLASLDGAKVMMREPGAKRGRPAERPLERTRSDQTAYRSGMAGAVSVYGVVPEGHRRSKRRQTCYASHMPETQAPAFKAKFEQELSTAEAHAPRNTNKVLLCDGARSLWKYAGDSTCYENYEMLADFWNALEHMPLATEALFGKSSKEARAWHERHADKLLFEDDGAFRYLCKIDYHCAYRSNFTTSRKALAQQRTLFVNNGSRMRYAEFRRRGLPIGSGPVEVARKIPIKTSHVQKRNALAVARRSSCSGFANLRQVQPIGCLLETHQLTRPRRVTPVMIELHSYVIR